MTSSTSNKNSMKYLFALLAGVIIGAYLFIGTQPRSFPEQDKCGNSCYGASELVGLAGSVGLHLAPGMLPKKVAETERCIAMDDPSPEAAIDIVVIPKKDILDIADVAEEDVSYVVDCIGMIRTIVRERQLSVYKVITNGQGLQKVRYLHFHILADKSFIFRTPLKD